MSNRVGRNLFWRDKTFQTYLMTTIYFVTSEHIGLLTCFMLKVCRRSACQHRALCLNQQSFRIGQAQGRGHYGAISELQFLSTATD